MTPYREEPVTRSEVERLTQDFAAGCRAGDADRHVSECPFAPHSQILRYHAWMSGYQEGAGPNYTVRQPLKGNPA